MKVPALGHCAGCGRMIDNPFQIAFHLLTLVKHAHGFLLCGHCRGIYCRSR